jgi:hypothetical protein
VIQLPGSLSAFFSRSNVTSAAVSGGDNSAAIMPPAATEKSPPVVRFDGRNDADVPSKRFGNFPSLTSNG